MRDAPLQTIRYGPDPSQVADLHLPRQPAPPAPVVVVLHGGFWRARYGRDLGAALAADLAAHGYVAWNVEYRRVGNGGGWPATLADVAAAVDALADLTDLAGRRLDLRRVVTLGHSAGGHLAVWAAARHRLPDAAPGAAPRVRPVAAITQAGVLDLEQAAAERLGAGAVLAFLGGGPEQVPERYAVASPAALVPLGVPLVAVHGDADEEVPIEQSRRFVQRATAAGDNAELVVLPGIDHYALITGSSPAWTACREAVTRLVEPA